MDLLNAFLSFLLKFFPSLIHHPSSVRLAGHFTTYAWHAINSTV